MYTSSIFEQTEKSPFNHFYKLNNLYKETEYKKLQQRFEKNGHKTTPVPSERRRAINLNAFIASFIIVPAQMKFAIK